MWRCCPRCRESRYMYRAIPARWLRRCGRRRNGKPSLMFGCPRRPTQPAFAADGRIHMVRRGSSASSTVLAIGPTLDPVLEAVAGLDVSVLYTSTVAPLDAAGLRRMVTASLTIVEPYLTGTTLAGVVRALGGQPVGLQAIGVDPVELRRYGTRYEHRAALGLDAIGIRHRLSGDVIRPALIESVAV